MRKVDLRAAEAVSYHSVSPAYVVEADSWMVSPGTARRRVEENSSVVETVHTEERQVAEPGEEARPSVQGRQSEGDVEPAEGFAVYIGHGEQARVPLRSLKDPAGHGSQPSSVDVGCCPLLHSVQYTEKEPRVMPLEAPTTSPVRGSTTS
jgi:hypothetical protein